MPAFCAFYSMTPDEYRAITIEDFDAMARFIERSEKGR
jgi:hypothetical protein